MKRLDMLGFKGIASLTILNVLLIASLAIPVSFSLEFQDQHPLTSLKPLKHQEAARRAVAAQPPIEVPPTEPIVVKVLEEQEFANSSFNPVTKEVSFPEGAWSKIVLKWDAVMIGPNFDRFYAVFIDDVEIFRGTTPQQAVWTVNKDVTIYSSLLKGTVKVDVVLPNWVLPKFGLTGRFFVNLTFFFYPPPEGEQAPRVPDIIIPATPLPNPPSFMTPPALLHHVAGTSAVNLTIPEDAEKVVIQVYATGHALDEAWYFWPGPKVGGFSTRPVRLINLFVDELLVGTIAPFPYVYTGGWNPFLWLVTPGAKTFNIPAYFIDITPFLGGIRGTHVLSLNITNGLPRWFISVAVLVQRGNIIDAEIDEYFLIKDEVTVVKDISIGEWRSLQVEAVRHVVVKGTIKKSDGEVIIRSEIKVSSSNLQLRDDTFPERTRLIRSSSVTETLIEKKVITGEEVRVLTQKDMYEFTISLSVNDELKEEEGKPIFERWTSIFQRFKFSSDIEESMLVEGRSIPISTVRFSASDSVLARGMFSAELKFIDGAIITRIIEWDSNVRSTSMIILRSSVFLDGIERRSVDARFCRVVAEKALLVGFVCR